MATEKDNKAMQTVGALLIGFAAADLIDAIPKLLDPATFSGVAVSSNLDAATTNSILGAMVGVVIAIVLVLNLLQIYFGYRGLKLTPTKGIATFCLVIGILVLLGAISDLSSGVIFSGLFSACAGVVGILYYVYAKRLLNF